MFQYFWRRSVGNYVNWLRRSLSDIKRISAPYVNWVPSALSDLKIIIAPYVNWVPSALSDLKIIIAPYVNWDVSAFDDANTLVAQFNFNSDFSDSSLYENPSELNLNSTFVINTTEKKYGAGSLYFSNVAVSDQNAMTVTPVRSGLFAIGDDFTIQLFCRWENYDPAAIASPTFAAVHGDWAFYEAGGNLKFSCSAGVVSTPFTPTLGVWYHIAVTRQAGSLVFWIDGVPTTGQALGNFTSSGDVLVIGNSNASVDTFSGYFDEFQFVREYKPIIVPTGGY